MDDQENMDASKVDIDAETKKEMEAFDDEAER